MIGILPRGEKEVPHAVFKQLPSFFSIRKFDEIIAFSDRAKEFAELGVEILGVSIDSHFTHLAWTQTPRNQGGIGATDYPLVADLNKQISRDYDVLLDGGIALRGLFLIDKDGVVRHQVVNDLPLGRSVDEALRMVKALQHFAGLPKRLFLHNEHGAQPDVLVKRELLSQWMDEEIQLGLL